MFARETNRRGAANDGFDRDDMAEFGNDLTSLVDEIEEAGTHGHGVGQSVAERLAELRARAERLFGRSREGEKTR